MKVVVLAGYLGPVAHSAAAEFRLLGYEVVELQYPDSPGSLETEVDSLVCFPFSGPLKYRDHQRVPSDTDYFDSLLDWARASGVKRIVLRSHAFAYGSSFKNYGLMEEDRVSLLDPGATDQRWLACERLLEDKTSSFAFPSSAILRMTQIAEREEGDFITNMLSGRVACPMAGYDPRIQFLSLEDAVQAVVCAVQSEGSGVFNIAGSGTVPFRRALKASVPLRIPLGGELQKPFRKLFWRLGLGSYPADFLEQVRYNFTISNDRAERVLGFSPKSSSMEAFRDYLDRGKPGKSKRLGTEHDDFGLDPEYLGRLNPWFSFLTRIYWRVETEGLDKIPLKQPAVVTLNHRGFMPFDGVVHRSLILKDRKRHIRFLVIPSLFKFPFLSDFLIKQGGVVASQQNSKRLLDQGELVGIFPEGINGAFRMYKGAYKMGPMGRDMFARIAIENQVPVIPAVAVGHVEIFPILGKINWRWWKKFTGWPFFPITPTFPFLPVPLPTKWHIRYLDPIPTDQFRPEDVQDSKLVREFSNHVRAVMQQSIDDMLAKRKHIFFGNIFDKDGGNGPDKVESPETR